MAVRRVRCIVQGRVQGVFFRAHTHEQAIRLALCGWVFNRPDGAVEAEFQGEEVEVGLMINWLQVGAPMSQVSNVTTTELQIEEGNNDFQIRY